jgi:hypothetical protein
VRPSFDARTILAQGFDALAGQPRDASDAVLTWPDGVREQVARWLAPEASKPNGRGSPAERRRRAALGDGLDHLGLSVGISCGDGIARREGCPQTAAPGPPNPLAARACARTGGRFDPSWCP